MTYQFFQVPLDTVFVIICIVVIGFGWAILAKLGEMKWLTVRVLTELLKQSDKSEKKLSSKIRELKSIVEQEEKQFKTSEEIVDQVNRNRGNSMTEALSRGMQQINNTYEVGPTENDVVLIEDVPPAKKKGRPKGKPHPRHKTGPYLVDLNHPLLRISPQDRIGVENSLLYLNTQLNYGSMKIGLPLCRELVKLYEIVNKHGPRTTITVGNMYNRLKSRYMTLEQAVCTPANGKKLKKSYPIR